MKALCKQRITVCVKFTYFRFEMTFATIFLRQYFQYLGLLDSYLFPEMCLY